MANNGWWLEEVALAYPPTARMVPEHRVNGDEKSTTSGAQMWRRLEGMHRDFEIRRNRSPQNPPDFWIRMTGKM